MGTFRLRQQPFRQNRPLPRSWSPCRNRARRRQHSPNQSQNRYLMAPPRGSRPHRLSPCRRQNRSQNRCMTTCPRGSRPRSRWLRRKSGRPGKCRRHRDRNRVPRPKQSTHQSHPRLPFRNRNRKWSRNPHQSRSLPPRPPARSTGRHCARIWSMSCRLAFTTCYLTHCRQPASWRTAR